ncbi:hypothetical protein BH11MYX2_BH11MYX2_36180 [soil metagenome]
MRSRILELVIGGYWDNPRAAAVRRAFALAYPHFEATTLVLRAHEATVDVVAVIYRERTDPRIRCGMSPYKLSAVGADLVVVELPSDPHSPYALRGIK